MITTASKSASLYLLFLPKRALTFFCTITVTCLSYWHSTWIPGIWGSPVPQWLQPVYMAYWALERLQGDQCGLKRELWRRCSNEESQVKQYCSSFTSENLHFHLWLYLIWGSSLWGIVMSSRSILEPEPWMM